MSAVATIQDESSTPASTHESDVSDHRKRFDLSAAFAELLNSAQLTAVTASIANTMVSRPGLLNDKVLSCYLPPAPTVVTDVYLLLIGVDPTPTRSARLGKYYDELSAQRMKIENCCRHSQALSADGVNGISAIAEAWRALATLALAAIHEVSSLLAASEWRPNLDRAELVNYILRRAAAGDAPCVDPNGLVEIPPWTDRRRDIREPRGLQAILQIEDSLQRVAVLDVSESGIGVLGLTSTAVGSRVGLLIKPGSKLDGTVIWVNGARAGIRLDSRLPANSQLLDHLS